MSSATTMTLSKSSTLLDSLKSKRVIVKFINSDAFIDLNRDSLSKGNNNYSMHNMYHLTFPLGKDLELVDTKLTKEEAEEIEAGVYLPKGSLQGRSPYLNEYFALFNKAVPTILNLNNYNEVLMYKCLLANEKTIAFSESEAKNKGGVLFIIKDEQAEIEKAISSMDEEMKAIEILSSLSPINLRQILIAKGEFGVESLADNKVRQSVYTILKASPKEFLRLAEIISDSAKNEIGEMLHYNILVRSGTKRILIEETGEQIGTSLEQASEWYKNPDNAKVVIVLKNKLQNIKSNK